MLSLFVFIRVVIIIIDSDSMIVWFRLVMICGRVDGNLIFYKVWCGVVLNVCVVLSKGVGVELILRWVRWIGVGRIKIMVVIRLGIMLMLKNMMVGIRYIKVGRVCIRFSIG